MKFSIGIVVFVLCFLYTVAKPVDISVDLRELINFIFSCLIEN